MDALSREELEEIVLAAIAVVDSDGGVKSMEELTTLIFDYGLLAE